MFACGQTALMLMLIVLSPTLWAADEARPQAARVDHYGDPLPPGAIARLGTLRMRHQGSVASMDFSPDGKILASCGESKILVRLWDTATGKETQRITGAFRDEITVVKFSPAGRILAGGSHKPKPNIFLWDVATGKLLHRLEGTHGFLWDVAFLDEKTLVSVDDEGQVRWWDAATGKKLREWDSTRAVQKPKDGGPWEFCDTKLATLARDGRTLAAIIAWQDKSNKEAFGKYHHCLTVWDLQQHKKRWHLPQEMGISFFRFDLSADGKLLALFNTGTSTAEDHVSLRDGITGREVRRLKIPEGDNDSWEDVALSRDGKRLAILSAWTDGIRLWDIAGGKAVHQLAHNIVHASRYTPPRRMVLALDGKTLAFSWEDTVALWDVASSSERSRWRGHREPVSFLSFTPDGKTLLSGVEYNLTPPLSYPRLTITWDTATWRELARSEHSSYKWFNKSLLFVSPDHRLGVGRNEAGYFFVTERAGGKKIRPLPVRSEVIPHGSGGFFSPSGNTIVFPVEKPKTNPPQYDLALLDAATGKRRGYLPEKAGKIFLIFAPDDRIAAWIDEHALIHVVAVDGGKELRRLGRAIKDWDPQSTALMMALSPDGRHLAFWERQANEVVIWDWRTGQERRLLPGLYNRLASQICLAYSPDGRCLAVGGMADEKKLNYGNRLPANCGDEFPATWAASVRLLFRPTATCSLPVARILLSLSGISMDSHYGTDPYPRRRRNDCKPCGRNWRTPTHSAPARP
jgi:WD40 repeat protein